MQHSKARGVPALGPGSPEGRPGSARCSVREEVIGIPETGVLWQRRPLRRNRWGLQVNG